MRDILRFFGFYSKEDFYKTESRVSVYPLWVTQEDLFHFL